MNRQLAVITALAAVLLMHPVASFAGSVAGGSSPSTPTLAGQSE